MKKHKQRPPQENPLGGDFAPPAERQFYSVAFLCQMLQKPPEFIGTMMRAAEVEFAYCENGIGWIRGDDVQKLAATVADAREEIQNVMDATANN